MTIDLNKCYRVSEDVIAREIEGELIIVPLKSGVGNLDSEMYALNQTGIAIWKLLDGNLSLNGVINALSAEYNAPQSEINADVIELIQALIQKGLVLEP
jgi:hypothetical protein